MMQEIFRKFATRTAKLTGSAWAFFVAFLLIVGWLSTGPLFDYSTTWQLTINSFTTVVTFLMVFIIQNSQNRDSKAIHLKLDELLKTHRSARNQLLNLEDSPDQELAALDQEFKDLRAKTSTATLVAAMELQEKKKQVTKRSSSKNAT